MTAETISGLISTGITLTGAATVTKTGTIQTSAYAAVSQDVGAASLANDGVIAGDIFGVSLGIGGTIINYGGAQILGVAAIEVVGLAAIDNFGTIGGLEIGIVAATAAVTNQVTGRITGDTKFGGGTLTNFGTVAGATGDIVSFDDGGTVLNLGSAAALTGGDVLGVAIGGGAGYVTNQGSISGVALGQGGTVNNAGFIGTGIDSLAVQITLAPAAVDNTGTIIGVSLAAGGSIVNAAPGTITGYADGIDLSAGGVVNNSGKILGIGARLSSEESGRYGLSISGAGSIVNNVGGLIEGSNDGIQVGGTGAGAVTIINHGTIIGAKGISVASALATTIVDYGTITGTAGTAIAFEGGNDVLVMESGAVINGIVVGGYGADDVSLWVEGTLAPGVSVAVESGGALILTGAVAASETISFAGTNATLTIDDPSQFVSPISGMTNGDTIDLPNLAYDPWAQAYLTTNNILEIVGNGTTSLQVDPAQTYLPEFFHISSDGLNGTDVTESTVPCFLEGTRIATPSGSAAVQDLAIGDLVMTADRAPRPLKWIGRRAYNAPLPNDPDVIPTLIKAGALGPNVPSTDLYLSPQHAVRIDGMLVPAGALINGVSVLACPDMQSVRYYHLELESHDIVLANGAEAETFIDHDSRKMFDNAEEFYRLYPRDLAADAVLCTPRLEFGPELEAMRRRIALRAGLLLDQPSDAAVVGFLEHADRQTISGWAYAPTQPNLPVRLDIFNRGALLARTVANIPRPDVKAAGFGHGRCGFSISLPAPLPALLRHEISVRPFGQSNVLTGSPVILDPGIAHDLLRSGGLKTLIEAAVQGLGSESEIRDLGNSLEAVARQIRNTATLPPRSPKKPAAPDKLVLVIDAGWPTITRDAGSNAIMSHVEALLGLGHTVAFCAAGGPPADDDAAAGLERLRELGVLCHGQDGATTEDTIRALAGRGLDFVYLHRLAMATAYAGLVRSHAPGAKIIYAVADLHHLRLARHAEVAARPDLTLKARSVRAAELWAMQLADCVITHSRFEYDHLRREAPQANVYLVPWAVRLARSRGGGRDRRDIAFIGGAGHAPNIDAVMHLANDIMPIVWQTDPSIRCLVAGPGWAGNMFAAFDPRIVNLGHQPDLTPLLRSVRLTVAPLRFGAGLKGKVLESLAAGTPCVMSSVAAEGLLLEPTLRQAIADGPDFAARLLAVYTDKALARSLSEAGRDLVETCFSAEAVRAALAMALGQPATPRPARSSSAPGPRRAAPAPSPRLRSRPAPVPHPPSRRRLPNLAV